MNAGGDTAYRVAIGGHRMTVTHTDGFAIVPFEVDAFVIGMGERYDVTIDIRSGVWPLVALAEGKQARAAAEGDHGQGKAHATLRRDPPRRLRVRPSAAAPLPRSEPSWRTMADRCLLAPGASA